MTVTVRSDELKASLKAIQALVEEVRIVPAEDGWHMYAMSVDKTMLVDVRIPKESFEEYEEWAPFTVMVKDMLDPLAKAAQTTKVDTSTGRLRMRTGRISFIRPLQADEDVTPRFPDLELDAECIVDVDKVTDILTVMSGDPRFKACRFTQSEEDLKMEVFEDDSDLGEVLRVPRGDCVMLEGQGRARFSMYAIAQILKSVPKGTEIDLLFSTNKPMMASYTVGGTGIRFMMAPQWEDDDDGEEE